MSETIDVCANCNGALKIAGHLGGIEYRSCVKCRANHTWNVNKPWDNLAVQIQAGP